MLIETTELSGIRAVSSLDEADVIETAEVACKACGDLSVLCTMWFDFASRQFICTDCAEAMDKEVDSDDFDAMNLGEFSLGEDDFAADCDF